MGERTGKKERIMIACVTFETVKVTDPVRFYECNRVHLIHYLKSGPSSNVYAEFYDRVCEIITEENRGVEIKEHNKFVSDFPLMLSEILSIIEEEQRRTENDCEIFVNISAGSPEFTAAAAIGSMMSQNVTPFTVPAQTFTVLTDEDVRRTYYKEGKPVGLTDKTKTPKAMPCYSIDKPKEHLVRGLRVLHQRNETGMRVKSSDIITVLKDMGVWYRSSDGKAKQSEAVQFHRDYVLKWQENGWIKKDELRKRFVLTEEGESVIKTFYLN